MQNVRDLQHISCVSRALSKIDSHSLSQCVIIGAELLSLLRSARARMRSDYNVNMYARVVSWCTAQGTVAVVSNTRRTHGSEHP